MVAGALAPEHRARVGEILGAAGVFRAAEVAVGLELFDCAFGEGGGFGANAEGYAFVGAFVDELSEAGRRTPEGRLKAVGALAGFACWGRTPGCSGTYDLYWLAVDPAVQGAGAGSVLVGEVERRVASEGGRLIVIEVSGSPHSDGARRSYERQAYVPVATVRNFYAPGDDRIIYTKRVPRTTGGGGADA